MRRYPGLNYFTTEQKAQFFGREDEKAALLALVLTEKIVALFGKSGYGKSSLLRAGLIPDLPADWLPIVVQLGAYQPGQSLSPLERTLAQLDAALPGDTPETAFLEPISDPATLWHRFRRKQGAENRTFLLLFDQFEEFQTYPLEQRAAFKQQLAELLFTRIPQAVRDAGDELPDAQQALLASPNEVRALFAIREDRLSALDSLADKLPAILHKRYHLKGLDEQQATEAIEQPARLPQGERFESPAFHYEPAAVLAIKQGLKKGEHDASIESFLLQICCEEIERTVIGRAKKAGDPAAGIAVTERDLPVFKDLFEQYYRNKIAALPGEALQTAARRMIEDHLVKTDPAAGIAYRINVDGRTLCALPGVDESLLKRLTDVFLLRSEPNTTDGFSYEVSHDRLVEGILVMKKAWEAEEAERRRLEAVAAEEARIAADRAVAERRRRRALVTAVVAGMLILGAVGASVFAIHQQSKAADAFVKAKAAEEKAEGARRQSRLDSETARKAEAEAEQKEREATEAQRLADAALAKLKAETDPKSKIFFEATEKWGSRENFDVWKMKVDSLDLRDKNLHTLPIEVFECKNLVWLNLGFNKGLAWSDELPKLGKMKKLTHLVLPYSELKPFLMQIEELKNLTGLDLKYNHAFTGAFEPKLNLEEALQQLGGLKKLTYLDLSDNGLTELPSQIEELKNLTYLDLSRNQLTALPDQIAELKKLAHLDLNNNKLTAFPPQIVKLKKLTHLDLSATNLTVLPVQIVELENLTHLNLGGNQLNALPAQLWELKNLTHLDLGENQLDTLPVQIGKLINLTELNLWYSSLKALPAQIVELKNLIYLGLGNNSELNFEEALRQIGELKNLAHLDLRYNKLTTFPTQLVELKNLTHLNLDNNSLSTLPVQIGELKNLIYLGLGVNPIPETEIEKIKRMVPAGCVVGF